MPKFKKRLRTWVAAEIAAARCRKQHRKYRILIYARYSTDDQNPLSIDAQVDEVKRFLVENGVSLKQVEIRIVSDEGISGTLQSRPGIDQVKLDIERGSIDLLISEEASRLYRNYVFCVQLVDTAVDAGIRVMCLSDRIDTADEEDVWDERLRRACEHHAESSRYTRRRIRRSLLQLHESGAAVGPLRSGYKRRATHAATKREPEKGPFYDSRDEQWVPVVHEAFVRVADGEALEDVAEWLTEMKLPKTSNAHGDTKSKWGKWNVISLIRETMYRGLSCYRVTVTKHERQTGRARQVPNEPESISEVPLPELRIVPDWLHRDANKAIDDRRTRNDFARGSEHRLFGIPRDSRGPLSRIAVCGICGAKMHVDGRLEGGYRCGKTRGKNPACWNRATTLCDHAHKQIGSVIAGALRTQIPVLLEVLERLRDRAGDNSVRESKLAEVRERLAAAEEACHSLAKKIDDSEMDLESLFDLLKERETDRNDLRCEVEKLQGVSGANSIPSRESLHDNLLARCHSILSMDRTARKDIEPLVLSLRFTPYQQFDSAKVVLRAELELNLWNALPYVLRAKAEAILGDADAVDRQSFVEAFVIDLFEPSTVPKFAMRVLELRQSKKVKAVAAELGISEMSAKRCLQYAKQLHAAGLVDPFVKLESEPESASRWRIRRSA